MSKVKDVYTAYSKKLARVLPMNDVFFIAQLYASQLLPDEVKISIAARATHAEKASFFLGNYIEKGFDDNGNNPLFLHLLKLMQGSGDLLTKSLANEISSRINESVTNEISSTINEGTKMSKMKDVYKAYYAKLVRVLPMSDAIFMAQLYVSQLLTDDARISISARVTAEKASFFLDNYIERGFDDDGSNPLFLNLLKLMQRSDNLELKSVANEINSRINEVAAKSTTTTTTSSSTHCDTVAAKSTTTTTTSSSTHCDTVATKSATTTTTCSSTHCGIFNQQPEMFDITKIVIPRIMHEWEYIAEALHYDLTTIKEISDRGHADPKKCCREFFKDWLMSNNGAKAGPKVWSTLLDVLKEVDEISTDVTEDIIAEVKKLN